LAGVAGSWRAAARLYLEPYTFIQYHSRTLKSQCVGPCTPGYGAATLPPHSRRCRPNPCLKLRGWMRGFWRHCRQLQGKMERSDEQSREGIACLIGQVGNIFGEKKSLYRRQKRTRIYAPVSWRFCPTVSNDTLQIPPPKMNILLPLNRFHIPYQNLLQQHTLCHTPNIPQFNILSFSPLFYHFLPIHPPSLLSVLSLFSRPLPPPPSCWCAPPSSAEPLHRWTPSPPPPPTPHRLPPLCLRHAVRITGVSDPRGGGGE